MFPFCLLATSTFCVGAENEPDGAPEDWMRIAELQARNKACLPHLKSSYPVEFDVSRYHTLTLDLVIIQEEDMSSFLTSINLILFL